ncbi:MAG: glutamine synthetase family protein [Lachnospiraceae bacterium]|nr:glutamine synthetase family protein [Lachnospiraceae bacterium]
MSYTKEDIFALAEEEDVEFIRLQFSDMFGAMKNLAITRRELGKALKNRCMFDGSLIDGFARIEESDMYLHPDTNTFVTFPWRPQQGKVARLLCDIYRPDGSRFEGDPRFILQKAVKHAEEAGYTFKVGVSGEFFLFNTDENGAPTTETFERAGYFDVAPIDTGENARRDMILALEDMGFEIESSQHEIAPGQHSIKFHYTEAEEAADRIMTFKFAVKTIARRHGLHATFMPKPKTGVPGSGMHINMSLHRDGENVLKDSSAEDGLSAEARYFIGGLMEHITGMTAILNPIVNSYKRLLSGLEGAPVYAAWSFSNRTPLIRIPASGEENTRIELRSPDSASNPYLALALCLEAGLDGILNRINPPAPVEGNLFRMSEEDRNQMGIRHLPANLGEALNALEKDSFVRGILGNEVSEKYLFARRKEFADYCAHVSSWETEKYLYRI